MSKVISKDGTEIAYEKTGSGSPVILVNGALGYRALGFERPLVELLSQHFTVYSYDRRGRGESTNSKPFTIEREIEDIDALIRAAGGSVYVYGISSGACLALEAAIRLGEKIKKLALYEPPYDTDPAAFEAWRAYRARLSELVRANDRDGAVALFMSFVGTPPEAIEEMRKTPMWPMLEAAALTLPFDAAEIGDDRHVPVDRVAAIKSRTLVMDGGANLQYMPFMHASATALAKAIPNAQHRTLEGQTHDVKAEALTPVLNEFFGNP